ncbi:MAG: hypothetical protein ACR2QO_16275 [Acidimicrobiales bacterium]
MIAVGSILVTSCGEETPIRDAISTITTQPDGGEQPPETDPPETEPPTTETPTTAAPTTQPAPEATTSPTTGGPEEEPALSTSDWLILAAIALAAIAIFVVANNGANRRAGAKATAQSQLQTQLSDVVGGSRWVHDSGSIEVLLATDPNQVQTGWNEVRRRMVNVESQIATLAVGTGDPALDQNLRYLGQCVADLRGAEEGYVAAKVRSDGSASHDQLVRSSNDTVMARRQQLQAAIDPVAYAMQA